MLMLAFALRCLASSCKSAPVRFMADDRKRMDLVDMVCRIQSSLQAKFPFSWMSLAVDVAELFAGSTSFPERTDEAGIL